MIYSICLTLFLIGILGLLAQTLLGAGHGTHASHGDTAHIGHTGGHLHADHSHHHDSHDSHGGSSFWGSILTLLSPMTLFSLCFGAGATGLLLRPYGLPTAIVAAAAFVGGIAFYTLLIRPFWNLIFRFASKPALALEGTVAKEAEALTRFDAHGKGLVRLNIDGQLVRILATLEEENSKESAVLPGDKLVVTSVDGHTNTCHVIRL